MAKIIKLKPVLNKTNNQISSYFKSKQLPKDVVDKIRNNIGEIKYLKFTLEGFE